MPKYVSELRLSENTATLKNCIICKQKMRTPMCLTLSIFIIRVVLQTVYFTLIPKGTKSSFVSVLFMTCCVLWHGLFNCCM